MLSLAFPMQGQWEDVSVEALLVATTSGSNFGCGISCADYNGDGWDDVTFGDASGSIRLYLGGEDGYTADVELGGELSGESKGILWVDVDGDGDLDLFAGHRGQGVNLYIRDEAGSMVDESVARGMPDWSGWRPRGISACDFDGDEDLDIYIASYHISNQFEHYPNAFLINDGSGHFTLADDSVGVNNGIQTSFQGAWLDFDDDGWNDLWVINDRFSFSNSLYHNQGDGTFIDVAPEYGLDVYTDPMSATIFDPDLDGDWDLFSTEVPNLPYMFFRRTESGFEDVAEEIGLAAMDDYGWGACAVDIDGDMDEDLMVSTLWWPFENPVDNRMYLCDNDVDLHFNEDSLGWPNEQFALYHLGRLDMDGDRAPDLIGFGVIPVAQVLRNTNESGAARLTVQLVGITGNSHAVGAVIKVHADGVQQMQQVDAGADYVTQHSYRRFFGMGSAEVVDSLEVRWPNGIRETWYDLPADTALVLIQGTAGAMPTPLSRDCPWEIPGWLLPFDPSEVEMTWDGNPVLADTVWADAPGAHVLQASWWSGAHTMEWVVEADLIPQVEPAITVIEPGCTGGGAALMWSMEGASVVMWSDSVLSPGDSVLYLGEGTGTFAWHFGPECVLDTTVTVVVPPSLALALEYFPPACWGDVGMVQWEATGGTPPLSVDWGAVAPDSLLAGVWTVVLSDSVGCVLTDSVAVVIPDSLAALPDWSYLGDSDTALVELGITGGTPPYEVLWSGGLDEDGLMLTPGTIGWLVQDAEGCLAYGTLQLEVNAVGNPSTSISDPWICRREAGWIGITGPGGTGILTLFDLTGRMMASHAWISGRPVAVPSDGPLIIRLISDAGGVRVFLR